MIFIWFNPDIEAYEKGSMLDYDRKILSSANRDRFDLLCEFNATSIKLADKILRTLNIVRKHYLASSSNY